jgi:hypothetical protein
MHPAILAAGIGAVDAVIAGQVVYGVRRDRRDARKPPHPLDRRQWKGKHYRD